MTPSIYCFGLDGECFEFYNCQACEYYQDKVGEKDMSIVFNSSGTADTINRAVDNSMGTTIVSQGAESDGLIIKEDLTYILQGTEFTNPYQLRSLSGSVPLTFHSVAKPLKNYTITGNTQQNSSVGTRTANLFDEEYPNISGSIRYKTVNVGDVNTVTLSTTAPLVDNTALIYLLAGQQQQGADTDTNGVSSTTSRTVSPVNNYVTVAYKSIQQETPANFHVMLNAGQTASDYEPTGYKIPVVCAGQTSDIYIDDVLRKSSGQDPVYDILYSDGTLTRNVDTDGTPLQEPTTETFEPVIINTVFGSNTLTVDTTVKPSSVSIEYYDN